MKSFARVTITIFLVVCVAGIGFLACNSMYKGKLQKCIALEEKHFDDFKEACPIGEELKDCFFAYCKEMKYEKYSEASFHMTYEYSFQNMLFSNAPICNMRLITADRKRYDNHFSEYQGLASFEKYRAICLYECLENMQAIYDKYAGTKYAYENSDITLTFVISEQRAQILGKDGDEILFIQEGNLMLKKGNSATTILTKEEYATREECEANYKAELKQYRKEKKAEAKKRKKKKEKQKKLKEKKKKFEKNKTKIYEKFSGFLDKNYQDPLQKKLRKVGIGDISITRYVTLRMSEDGTVDADVYVQYFSASVTDVVKNAVKSGKERNLFTKFEDMRKARKEFAGKKKTEIDGYKIKFEFVEKKVNDVYIESNVNSDGALYCKHEYGSDISTDNYYISMDEKGKISSEKIEPDRPFDNNKYLKELQEKKKEEKKKRMDPYDVYDYDDGDEFADEWADEFGEGDFDDGWDDAYSYWEEHH